MFKTVQSSIEEESGAVPYGDGSHNPFSPMQFIAVGLVLLFSAGAQAAGNHSGDRGDVYGGGHAHAVYIGEPGKASEVTRIIEIVMTDTRVRPLPVAAPNKWATARVLVLPRHLHFSQWRRENHDLPARRNRLAKANWRRSKRSRFGYLAQDSGVRV